MKRTDLLMALGERSYFIGQVGAQISAVMGWNIDDLVGRVDEVYLYPLEEGLVTGTAVLEEIEGSAKKHIAEAILAYLPDDTPDTVAQLFAQHSYQTRDALPTKLPRNWQRAITETTDQTPLIKVLQPNRLR